MLIPPAPGVLCAEGLLAADLKAEFGRTVAGADVQAVFTELESEAETWLASEGIAPPDRRTARVALMCYEGQGGELAVPWAGTTAATEHAFAAAHHALYGFSLDAPIRLVTIRVEARGLLPPPVRPLLPPGQGARIAGWTEVHWAEGSAPTALYTRDDFGAGDAFPGPAIVTQLDTTTLVPPGWRCDVHASGALLLTRSPAS